MNVEFWEKHQETTLLNSIEMLKESHKSVMKIIDDFSNDELFAKGSFSWTGTSTLGSYCVSATFHHSFHKPHHIIFLHPLCDGLLV